MGTSKPPPVRPRERLGRELRAQRLKADLTGSQLAELIGASQSKVSRTELAKFRAPMEMVQKWLNATGADAATRERILEVASQAVVEVESYQNIFRGSLVTGQRIALQQEIASARIRHFQPFMIPGLLQSPEYARAALIAARVAGEADIDEAVETRMERGRRIQRPGASTYHVIMTEAALRWIPMGVPRSARVEAWETVLSGVTPRHITMQVIPLDTPMAQAPLCGFVLTEFRPETDEVAIAQVELPPVDMTFSGPTDLEAFEVVWDRMVEAALSPRESTQYLRRLLQEARNQPVEGS